MPTYVYRCYNLHETERYSSVLHHTPVITCACGEQAAQILTAPIMVKVAQDVCYDSPIDGRPITSWAQRTEDLARNNCQPYDPEMKTDAANRRKAEDAALDASIERTVEAQVERLSGTERNKLASEVLDQGMDLAYTRTTPE